ncbi:MAG: TonB-dependent receptor [Acidobacteriia bacterium]|nr:TonB-dependent receptor [Terriglobia bacterium]
MLLPLAASAIYAQVAGRLSGSVVDPSGAVIPGATVNVFIPGGREPVLTGSTNEAGLFLFIAVRPETYDVSVEAAGFTKMNLRGVKVSPVQENSLGTIKLDVRSANQTVEVSAEAQAVNTTSGEVSTTITSQMVQNLPVLGRQVSALFQTMPGVSNSSNVTSVNGLRSSYSNVTLDGINIQDNFIRTNGLDYMPMRPTIDQVAEITVSTSNETASIGGGSSQFILSTKSGSNQYHGSVYWYNRNDALAANDWFNNAYDVSKSRVNLNQPGAALGGHIIKDKLFFYANYETYKNKKTSPVTRTTLTDSAKNGIFTYAVGSATQTANLFNLRQFTADPTIKGMLSQLPAPNAPGGDGLNTAGYRFNARGNEFRDQLVYRGDYYINAHNSITGTYDYINNPTDRPDAGSFYTFIPPVTNVIKNHLLSLAWRWNATPTLTNEVRAGFARTQGNFLDSNEYPKSIVGGLLFSNPVNTFMNQGRQTNSYPIQSNANWSKGTHQIAFGFQYQRVSTAPFNDAGMLPTYNLGLSTANQALNLTANDLPGIKSSDLSRANSLYADLAGYITSATQTFNVTSTTSGFVPGATNLRQLSYSTYAGYVQDNWKVRPNLTLNVGMRYEYWTPLDEKNSLYLAPVLENNDARATVMDPNAVLDFIGKSSGRPFYNADKNNFAPNVGFAWTPFPARGLTVRGGYMMAYVNDNVITTVRNSVTTAAGLSSAPLMTNQTALLANPPTVQTPVYKVPRTLADNYAMSATSAVGIPSPNLVTPYVHQWNFTVQQEVKGVVLAAHYIGNKGSDLLRAIDYNQVLYNANGFLADFLRAQGNANLSEGAGKGFIGAYNPAIAGSQQLTVFPLLTNAGNIASASSVLNSTYLRQGNIGEMANYYMTQHTNGSVNFYTNPNVQGANVVVNGGSSIYHSVQLEATKRFARGLQAQFSYTFAKGLGNTAGDGQTNFEPLLDNNNPSLEWARTPYDIRHVLKANYYYELPFGNGRRWKSNRVVNAVIGGWAIGGIWNYQSGAPYSILSGLGTLNRDARSSATNTAWTNMTMAQLNPLTSGIWKTGDGTVYFASPTLIGSDGRGAAQFGQPAFDGQAFFNPAAGTVGSLQRRAFSGPWLWSWDASLQKSVTFKERLKLDLKFEAFNVGNHPAFNIYPTTAGDYAYTGYSAINSTTFGQVDYTQSDPRILQIGAYLRF